LVVLPVLASCEDFSLRREAKLDIGGDTISLPAGVKIHDVIVRSVAGGEFVPTAVQIRSNDVVRFKTGDSRTHILEFEEATLPASAGQLLRTKSQLRSPPLLVDGASWIVSFEGLPAGRYTFRCIPHGVSGSITVK
jgi:plastocyanin